VLNLIVTGAGRDVLSLIALLIVMLIQDPVMSLSMILGLPVMAFLIEKMMGRVRRIAKRQVSLTAEIGNYVRETAQGFRIVKAFRMEANWAGASAIPSMICARPPTRLPSTRPVRCLWWRQLAVSRSPSSSSTAVTG
jgi:ABC-type multidrug transport system fused ATPase/permease subunit